MRRSIRLLIMPLLLAALLSGCGFKPVTIELRTSASLPIRQGDAVTIAAMGIDSSSKERPISVTWSADPALAGTFSKTTGSTVVFNASATFAGDVVITGVSDILQDTLNTAVYAPVLELLAIAPASWTLADGASKVFIATGLDQHERPFAVNPDWGILGGIGWVDPSSGSSTTFYATALGTGTITATQGGKSGSSVITVNAAPSVLTSVVVTPSSATLRVGEQEDFTAEGRDQYGQPMAIVADWSVTGGVGSVSPASGSGTTFTAEAAGEGTVEATCSSITGSTSVTVTQKITLSGTIEDSETDTPVPGAEVRAYREDRTLAAVAFCDASGSWSMQPEIPLGQKVILQAGAPGYFVRTKGFLGEDASGLLMRIVPDDLEGFVEFMYETVGSGPRRVDPTGFQGFKILTQNPTGNGTFTQEQAEYLQSLARDSSNNIEMILNTSGYPAVIDPAEPYTPGSRSIYVIPDTDIPLGSAYWASYGIYTRVSTGGEVRMNPTNTNDAMLEHLLKHETGHSIYPSHTSRVDSMMHTPPTVLDYQPLDLKGTYISNEPTFIGPADGWNPYAIDYTENILKSGFGLDGTVGY